jgi:hypothetical protein
MPARSIFTLTIFIAALTSAAQTKDNPDKKILKGTGWLRNMTGLESCSWIIELDKEGKEKLEPLNFRDFKVKAEDGKRVAFTYVLSNVNSTCMVGKTVKLKSIKPVKD